MARHGASPASNTLRVVKRRYGKRICGGGPDKAAAEWMLQSDERKALGHVVATVVQFIGDGKPGELPGNGWCGRARGRSGRRDRRR
eukprot:7379836-Prymnesium_polylepis.1